MPSPFSAGTALEAGNGLRIVLNRRFSRYLGLTFAATAAAVFAGIEGSRPVLVEVQALVAPSVYGTPRRAVVGWDSGRLAMVMAVLQVSSSFKVGG